MKTKEEIIDAFPSRDENDEYILKSDALNAMTEWETQQRSELRKKIEELRDFFKIYKYSEVTKMTILVELNQILKEE